MKNILIIDDDAYICKLLVKYLNQHGFHAESTLSAKSGLEKAKTKKYDLILCDYRLPESDGLKMLKKFKSFDPTIPVIIMTAYGDVKVAVKSIKSGAYDYVTKPVQPEEILDLIREVTRKKQREESSLSFKEEFIPGSSKEIRKVLDHVRIVAPVEMTVLIQGETGSGKEFIARLIHFNSKRSKGPFIAVDCGALPKGLANSELFGHLKGSFTGASFDKKGVFEQANGGTLFLDEISNLGPDNQMKLLRALQERSITRVGGEKRINVDVRIIVASNEDLVQEVKKKQLREDLYHRINEFQINIPPLRERGNDVLEFADKLLTRASRRFNKEVKGYDESVRDLLLGYSWYGNIRELKNVINRAVLLCRSGTISINDIPDEIRNYQTLPPREDQGIKTASLDLKDAAQEAEREAILNALAKAGYNKSKAARLLNIDRKTLYNKLKELDISLSRGTGR
jgi:two-component system response regulator HydG